MADAGSSVDVAKAIGDPLATLAGLLAWFVPEGPARTALLVLVGLCAVLARLVYKYYLGVLAQGAAPEGSLERKDYDKLRASLAGDNLAARLYADWLTRFLDAVERFFGDTGMADRTLFPRAFGLKQPAPLWTAPAFDRCLLLALFYPIVTIFVIWAISGHVGPAEAALGLRPDLPGWWRGLAVAGIGFSTFAFRRVVLTTGWIRLVWAISTVAGGIAADVTGAGVVASAALGAGSVGVGLAVGGAFGATATATAAAVTVADAAGSGSVAVSVSVALVAIGSGSFAVPVLGLTALNAVNAGLALGFRKSDSKYLSYGVFLSLFPCMAISICLGFAAVSSTLKNWDEAGPMLLFLVLLTLLNAPFDWASLGLTRALLRRGLELGGWWPFLLALVDAALATLIIALLALTMVIGVQAFDELAAHGGGKPVLPLDTLFDGIAKNPAAPEYWWAYALLLSSMIPSLINLAISGTALSRGIPWLARLILNWIPEGKAVPEYKRQLAAIGLTLQMFAGAGLGIAAQAFLAWGLIFHLMPWIGLDLLDMARCVAALDLPMRIGQLFM